MANVSEMYVTDGSIPGSKHVLTIMNDGTVDLKWYHGEFVTNEDEPVITKRGDILVVEYGPSNLFGIKLAIPFLDKNGELDKRWVTIK